MANVLQRGKQGAATRGMPEVLLLSDNKVEKDFKKFIFKTVIQYLQQYLLCALHSDISYSFLFYFFVSHNSTSSLHNSLVSHYTRV